MSEDKPELAIGIDLGTTNSCVAVFINGHVEIITNESGNRTTPSYVAFTEEGQRHIGDAAKNQLVKNVKNTVYGSKRLIGRKFTDPLVQSEIKTFPFKVIEKNSRPSIEIKSKRKGYRYFTVEDIAAMILKRMVKMSQQFLNQKIKNVVITVPAYFNDAQRQATKNAGIVAGLKVLRIINEPTAAAIAYGQKYGIDNKTIAVYDLGGGTLDVSIVKVQNGSYSVLATCGDPHLGGEDFDQNVIEHFIKLYHMKTKKDVSKDNRAIQRLRNEVEKAKKQLTFATSANLEIESFYDNDDFSETLTRAKFEELNKDIFKSTLTPLQDALEQAKLKKSEIDEIILVGGSSRIPKVRQLVQEFFDGKEPFQKINPDEAIAYGAAIQASVLTGQSNSINLTDVNPLSLGMELNTKKMKVFIPRNTPIPTKATHTLTTSLDFQKEIMFPLYEGELPIAADNLFLGKFTLTNIQRAAKGVPRIKTTFEIDADGILQVSAEDLVTKKKQDINVEYEKNRPSPEEIEEMIKISLEYEKLDEKYNESVNARIKLSETVFMYKSSLAKKTLRKHQMDKLDKVVDDVIQWMNELKICSIEEYNEKLEKFEKNVKSIENEN